MEYVLQEYKRAFEEKGAIPLLESTIDIALVAYCGNDRQSLSLFGILLDNLGIPRAKVKNIFIHGKNIIRLQHFNNALSLNFPDADLKYTGLSGISRFDYKPVHRMLCVHLLRDVDNQIQEPLQYAYSRIEKTCFMNQIVITRKTADDIFGSVFDIQVNCNLQSLIYHKPIPEKEPSSYCSERRKSLQSLIDKSYYEAAFEQCLNEIHNGCEECPQAAQYSDKHLCPYFQLRLSEFYRNGWFVPQSAVIAHSLVRQAAKQGFVPASQIMAEDCFSGYGCAVNIEHAYSILSGLAAEGDKESAMKLASFYDDNALSYRNVPWIATLAKSGNYDMQDRIINMYSTGNYGVCANDILKQEWIHIAAESGNARYVKAMAEKCESDEKWAEACKWYKRLSEVSPDAVSDSKLEEIELKALTNGSTDEEIAIKGMDYLLGYHRTERNTLMAYRCLNYAKDKNIPLATGLLGQMYYYGIGIEKNWRTGMKLICEAVKLDDMLSMDIYIYVLHADEVEVDSWKTGIIESIDKEIAKDNPYAYYLKGKCCIDGRLYCQSYTDAFEMTQQAANHYCPPAQYQLAMMYLDGTGVPADYAQYSYWIRISAYNGYYKAKGVYGKMLFSEVLNRANAFRYLKDAYDQGFNDCDALWCLAQCYFDGISTNKDLDLAYSLCNKAAGAGNTDAQVRLCLDYFNGSSLQKDYRECAHWGEAALAEGNRQVIFETAYSSAEIGETDRAYELYTELAAEGNVTAMNNLGCLETDNRKAFEWFKKSADKGSSVAQYNIARYYRFGIATEKDEQLAFKYYLKSAKQDYKYSIIEMASLYRFGFCTEKNIDEAVNWYEKAISLGHFDSLLNLASLYLTDIGDTPKAILCYKRAAEKGLETAFIQLGEIYENGKGIAVDINNLSFSIFCTKKSVSRSSAWPGGRVSWS